MNGEKTLSENIADNGGVRVALEVRRVYLYIEVSSIYYEILMHCCIPRNMPRDSGDYD